MAEIAGVSIVEITAFGWSDDGQHIWITHKLSDGSEYRLVYPYVAAGHLITMLTHAARSASARRAARNPVEVAEGMDSNVHCDRRGQDRHFGGEFRGDPAPD